MQNERPPTGARVDALDFTASNGVKLVDIFDQLHAGVRDVKRRLATRGLTSDEMFEAFEALVEMYETLVTMAAWIETRPR